MMKPVKILSVDDEADLEMLLTQYFRRQIRKGEYEFTFAHNGLEALTLLLKNKDYDIILSDINMPEMDGLTLLTKINEMQNPALKCIMVSAYGDMGNIRQAMNNGAFDFATKPIDLDDLSVTIEKAIGQIKYIKEREAEHTQLESLKGDLAAAAGIQQAILPRVFPPFPELADQLELAASMTAAKDVGGDFYDFFRIDDERIGVVVADVSGKGIPAAIFMAVSRTLLRATAIRGDGPAACISYTNNLLVKESVDCMFVTVFYGIYNVNDGSMVYCNAAHCPPIVIRSERPEVRSERGERCEMLSYSGNMVVGFDESLTFTEGELQLHPGDTLFLFTDGVNEAINSDDEEFGYKRLEASLEKSADMTPQQIVEHVKADMAAFVGEEEQSDDITMLVLKVKQLAIRS